MEYETIRLLFKVAIILGLAFVASAVVILFLLVRLSESRSIVNCGSFSSYGEALKALPQHPNLDLNHNGIPCESLYKPTK